MAIETDLEHALIKLYNRDRITFLTTHPEIFEEAVKLAVSNRQPYAWRCAALIWHCMEENDARVRNHLGELIGVLPERPDGQVRELLKILLRMELDEDQEGFLFDFCMGLWEATQKDPSIRHTAFNYIARIVAKYPDLSREVRPLTRDEYLRTLSPGVKHSIKRKIAELLKSDV